MPHTFPATEAPSNIAKPPSHAGDPIHYAKGDDLPATINDTSRPVSPTPGSGTQSPVHHRARDLKSPDDVHRANMEHLDPDRSRSRSRSRVRDFVRSVSRSLSQDPFFRRGTPEGQEDEQKANIMREVHAAQASTHAGDVDRAARRESRSRSRAREMAMTGSRSGSRFRSGTPKGEEAEHKTDA